MRACLSFWTIREGGDGMPIVTVAEVQKLLNLGEDDMDGRLSDLTDAASALVESHLNRRLTKQERSEVYSGGGVALTLKAYPIDTVLQVTLDDVPIEAYALDAENGLLFRRQGWPPMPGGYRVTYVGGLAEIPAPIKQACALLVAALADSVESKGQQIASERLSNYQVTYARAAGAAGLEALSAAAAALLAPYRNRLY